MTGVRHVLPSVAEATALGASLTAVDDALLRKVEHLERRWWKGAEPYLTVTVDEDDAGPVFLEVCVRGRFARRSRNGAIEVGVTDELELSAGMPRARIEQLQQERPDVVAVALAILAGAGLNDERQWLSEGQRA
ncbi:MAG: hypothetical protein Q8O67_00995 [Deltaproteobacteria bacterium]|nr:hypothetical protein [Deltaproteobacteria bacterium]